MLDIICVLTLVFNQGAIEVPQLII